MACAGHRTVGENGEPAGIDARPGRRGERSYRRVARAGLGDRECLPGEIARQAHRRSRRRHRWSHRGSGRSAS